MPVMNIIQAVNDALKLEMRRDPRVVVLGEDVGKFGGVFRATQGLHEEFGEARVIDTPLAESGIIGTAIGMAMYGLKPVPEIQFADFIFPAFDQIVSELAKMRYRSGGQYATPVTIRTPVGGGIKGGHYHSQSPESLFIHTAGLTVVFGVLRGILIAVVVVIFGQWLIGPNLPTWASESKSLPMLQRTGDSLIAMLPPDLEKQVTDILQKRGIGGDETPADATPSEEEGTDALENGAPPVDQEGAPADAA